MRHYFAIDVRGLMLEPEIFGDLFIRVMFNKRFRTQRWVPAQVLENQDDTNAAIFFKETMFEKSF